MLLLDELERLAMAATPGPWHVRFADDDLCMGAVAISAKPETDEDQDLSDLGGEVVAACLVQHPPYVIPSDGKWQENAELIVALRNRLPELLRLARLGAIEVTKPPSPLQNTSPA